MSICLVVTTAPSFPSLATGHKQKEHPFSYGGGLLPSSGRFPLKGTALLRMIDSFCPHLSTSSVELQMINITINNYMYAFMLP